MLKKTYCLLQFMEFFAEDGPEEKRLLFVCNCTGAMQQCERLTNLDSCISEDIDAFLVREQQQYCIHAFVCDKLCTKRSAIEPDDGNEGADEDDEEGVCVDQLSCDPLLVAVYDGDSYGIVGTNHYNKRLRLVCKSCGVRCSTTRAVTHCSHVQEYRNWCRSRELEPEFTTEVDIQDSERIFPCVSYVPIPYPLPVPLKQKHDELNAGVRQFPAHLVPEITSDYKCCEHGHKWSRKDPVKEGWLEHEGVTIYKASTSITATSNGLNRCVYYRPTANLKCTCILTYDGQTDMLFNLNNREMFHIGFLFEYLHSMIEGMILIIYYSLHGTM